MGLTPMLEYFSHMQLLSSLKKDESLIVSDLAIVQKNVSSPNSDDAQIEDPTVQPINLVERFADVIQEHEEKVNIDTYSKV